MGKQGTQLPAADGKARHTSSSSRWESKAHSFQQQMGKQGTQLPINSWDPPPRHDTGPADVVPLPHHCAEARDSHSFHQLPCWRHTLVTHCLRLFNYAVTRLRWARRVARIRSCMQHFDLLKDNQEGDGKKDGSSGNKLWGWEVDGTASGSCPLADFGIGDVETSCSFMRKLRLQWWNFVSCCQRISQ
jgi:hypothetical protein